MRTIKSLVSQARHGLTHNRRGVLCVLAIACLAACAGCSRNPRPTCLPEDGFALQREERLADYYVRVWESTADDRHPYDHVVTIRRGDEVLACHDFALGLGAVSGTDFTGSGTPNLLVECYSGGAHCCHYDYLYELDDELTRIGLMHSPGGNRHGRFEDLDSDGIYEYIDHDDSFAYEYCAYAVSPAVKVILVYRVDQKAYVPASHAFPEFYREEIERDTAAAERALQNSVRSGWDETSKCSVLPLVLDYFYSGRIEEGWSALDRYYAFPDREAFREEIRAIVSASRYFALPPGVESL